ncbi:hypothetical protein Pmar_PMAR028395 [Perkinsus marinus ATCC 50983]|uniref:Uncharacterized protein n=1 Tax=Perkinsus marinus (strain ATCC 50983 / TXsc) TaxID=423536 RepID=C5M099_PERM5|nr:hypothetical protein Pmar_PMAR028395 [Perkinsus marinus ATCC 50983]EEQ97588.1 hypothetical protein Pmar_PMAR028395 [Perkinsus marinus ATCC 50983]|eukprot:XP_002764871.1 hypothetical protein Pmar_PMAR028395 [Perkinsus marinus ATCC 50983]
MCDDANELSADGCDYPTCEPSAVTSSGTRFGYVCNGGTKTSRDYCTVSYIAVACYGLCRGYNLVSDSGSLVVLRQQSGKLTVRILDLLRARTRQ